MLPADAQPGFLTIGQSTARAAALRGSQRGRMGRSFLVSGPPGSGKGAFVDDLLALLFCTNDDPAVRPCNRCVGCTRARARTHPDLVSGSPERWRELKTTGESIVAAARRWLASGAGSPIAGDRRVILIEDADRAGELIQSAMLKALEEPSDRHVYVLVASDPSQLLPTIRSRCELLRIGAVPRAELASWLMDAWSLPRDQADTLARISGGLSGRAASFASDPEKVAWRRRIQSELAALLEHGRADRFASVRELLDDASRRAIPTADSALGDQRPVDPSDTPAPESEVEAVRTPTSQLRLGALAIVDAWLELARDLMVAAAGRPEAAATAELLPGLPSLAGRMKAGELAGSVVLLDRVRDGLQENASPRLALEVAMLAWPSLSP